MPLRNPFRRQSDAPAPSLRERAADLRASLPAGRPQQTLVPEADITPEAVQEPATEAAGNATVNNDSTTERGADEEIDAIAGLEFGAYHLDTPLGSPQEWANRFSSHAMMLHIADRTLRMSKPETMAFIRDAGEQDPETPKAMLDGLEAARETLEGWSNLLGLARARYIVAASAACTEPPAQTEAPVVDPVPSEPVAVDTRDRTDLAAACDQAVIDWHAIQPKSRAEGWGDAQLDEALDAYGAVFKRAIREPSRTLSETQAKARLLLHDLYEHQGKDEDEETDDRRLIRVVLREVAGLSDATTVSEFHGNDFGPDTHIAELAAEFCRVYGRHAVKERAHMAGELAEAEWLPSYHATVALMEKLEATQPKTLLGTALKSLGAIGMAGWNARADGSADGMDPCERVGAQFQDALMADELAPISILGPDLVGLVNFSAATMEELRAVYEVADELGTAGHAQAWVGRSKVRGSSQDLNPAGRLAQWVGDALSDVVSTAISEARGRIPANDDDRRIRFEILARSIFQNDDPAGEAAFAREILATVER